MRHIFSSLNPWRQAQPKYIFILSAMRSGTTLMQHLIAQNPLVICAGETKVRYSELPPDNSLQNLRDHIRNYLSDTNLPDEKDAIYLEKVVHNDYLSQPGVLNQRDTFTVFIARDPLPALSSLMEFPGWPYTESLDSACWYYRERYKKLAELSEQLKYPKQACFVTYEDLIQEPAIHLQRLTTLLRFQIPLKESYPKQKWTARLSLGDVSENIKSQQIVPNKRSNYAPLTDDQKSALRETYKTCTERIRKACG